jgi:ribose transport system substrate-binding protein
MQRAPRGARRWIVLCTVGALALAACGDDDDAGDDATDATEPAEETSAGATEATEATDAPDGTADMAEGGTIEADVRAEAIELTADELAALEGLAGGSLVGIVAATMETEYHKILNETIQARAEELGFEAEIFDSQTDVNRQLQGIEGFISKGADAIIVTGLGGESIGPVAEEAAAQGIFVVQVAGRDLGEIGAVTVSVEEEDIATAEGTAAGEYATETYGGDQIKMVITDYPELESLVFRADTIEEAFLAAYPNAEFIPRILGGTAENGIASMETALQANSDIAGVLGINDAGNLGAYQALENAGKGPDDVFIFGIDCDPQAVELIDSGTMYKGCVDTNPAGTGVLALDAFAKWFAGGSVPGIIEVPVIVYTGT